MTVTYAPVGATKAADLLRSPPEGFRAREGVARIGQGAERWEWAALQVVTWGVKRRSGFRVRVTGRQVVPGSDTVSGSDGVEVVHPGDTAVISIGPLREPVLVVYLVDEPRRRGFGYGTLPGHPVSGEESFIVELRDDDSVWLTMRSFSRPGSRGWAVVWPLVRVAQAVFTRRYLRALAGRMR